VITIKDLDYKLRKRFEQREYYRETRVEKMQIKKYEKEKKQSIKKEGNNGMVEIHCKTFKNKKDFQEVKRGKWIDYNNEYRTCSHCRKYFIEYGTEYDFNYCPHCGARMEALKQ
jgi:hypothetical protein